MSKITNGLLGLVAASVAFGAVRLASGSDLAGSQGQVAQTATQIAESTVNREAKGDRALVTRSSGGVAASISLTANNSSGTLVVRRLPAATAPVETARNMPAPNAPRSARPSSMLACEPVVSVLTAAAKQLPPGRCVT